MRGRNKAASDIEKARFCTNFLLLENCYCLDPEPESELFQSRNRNRNKSLRFHNTGSMQARFQLYKAHLSTVAIHPSSNLDIHLSKSLPFQTNKKVSLPTLTMDGFGEKIKPFLLATFFMMSEKE